VFVIVKPNTISISEVISYSIDLVELRNYIANVVFDGDSLVGLDTLFY